MKVKFFPCSPFMELCYVAWDEQSLHCLVIDPGMCCDAEWERVRSFIADNGLVLDLILITHNHTDHIMGTGYLHKAYPHVPICGSMEDQNHLPSIPQQNMLFNVDLEVHYAPITQNVIEGDRLWDDRIEVIDCPGHSHHGLCFYLKEAKMLFCGDVLFAGSVGRSDFGPTMGCNGRLLAEGIVQKLFTLPADVRVYPGHGMHTTIGYERETNPYV